MARLHSTMICGLALVVLGATAIALAPRASQQCQAAYWVHLLTSKIESHRFSRHPEDDVIELVRAIESRGGERRGLAALIPLANSSNPQVADWAIFAIRTFRSTTPEVLDALVRMHNDESHPAEIREFAASGLLEIDPAFATAHGVFPPTPQRGSRLGNPPVADAPGSP
jgi:hypothetical protein